MKDMVNKLRELVGIPVSFSFYVGKEPAFVPNAHMKNLVGTIKSITIDGVMEFEHIESEAARMQIKESFLDLGEISIWSIDPLADDYDYYSVIRCPECKHEIQMRLTKNVDYE